MNKAPNHKQTKDMTHMRLNITHQNINRLEHKSYKLEAELQQLEQPVDILCLTEHWLNSHQICSVNILNFSLRAHFSRSSRRGGGACIYARSNIVTMERPEITQLSDESHFETCAIECIGLDVIVVCIYRPPSGDIQLYISKLTQLLNLDVLQNYRVLIIGDINIDLLTKSTISKNLNNTIKQFGFRQLVNIPTRVTYSTSTCIDHAFSNMAKSDIVNVSCDELNLSDHLCINVAVNIHKNHQLNNHALRRNFTKNNIANFQMNLDMFDWNIITSKCKCPGDKIGLVINVIKHYFDICFPLKKLVIKKPVDIWVSDAIRQLRYQIRKLKFQITNEPNDTELRLSLQNKEIDYWSMQRAQRSDYINNQISQPNVDMCRSVWRVIASETCKNNTKKNSAINIFISQSAGDCDTARAADAASRLNRYYVSTNNSDRHPCVRSALQYLSQYLPFESPPLQLEPFTLSDIINAIKKIKRKNSKDINDMSTRLLDYLPPVVVSIFLMLFNQCVLNGVYPDSLKLIKVLPIYKGKGETNLEKCYRPISLIPVISKLFESLISSALMGYLTARNLLNSQQYAYQPGRSTADACRDVVARVLSHLEGGRRVAAIFCDLSRAFELVDHTLLLSKLSKYGINGGFYNTIASFLKNRKQCTYVVDSRSELEQIGNRAVPQGSSMGNYLFLILVNDIPTACPDLEFITFADDTCVLVDAENFETLEIKLTNAMHRLSQWFAANGMQLNTEKTNIMHFQLRSVIGNLNISLNGVTVPQVDQVQYLGCTIDSGLTWSPHIQSLCDRLASACFALSRLAPTLSYENMKKAYYGYFHSLLTQAVDLWGTAADRDKAFKMQKRAIRIVTRKPYDHPAKDLFRESKILTLPAVYILTACNYVRANLHGFDKTHAHSRSTRRRNLLITPRCRLAKSRKSLGVIGVKLYNSLPQDISELDNDILFRNKLKTLLIDRAYYSIDEFFG
jgi:hypothetical protein